MFQSCVLSLKPFESEESEIKKINKTNESNILMANYKGVLVKLERFSSHIIKLNDHDVNELLQVICGMVLIL